LCRHQNSFASIIARLVLNKINESSSFKIECPLKVGNYFVTNMTLEFPSVLMAPNGYFCVHIKLMGKPQRKKKSEIIGAIRARVQLK
jgi:hypothetical protein